MVIDGVDRYRVMDPLFECVRVVLSHRGEKYSPAYIQGISGAAFRIAGPCPCAPTCSAGMDTEALPELLGYEVEYVPLHGEGIYPERDVHEVVARVKAEIRAGRPTIVWHAFTNAEWDVVCGFDEEKKQLLGRGSYRGGDEYAAEDETRTAKCLDICPALGALLVGEKTGRLDARPAELAALEEAIRHANSAEDRFLVEAAGRDIGWRFREGLACYDWWINRFRVDPDRVPDAGDRYPLGVYRSTHRAAGEFLREIAPRYPQAESRLKRAAEHFASEADALDECHDEVFQGWAGWKEPDPRRAARAAELLSKARESYAAGINEIEEELEAIAPERVAAAHRRAVITGGKGTIRIERVPELAWERGKDNTFAGALEAAMKVTDHPYEYADIMGLTGLAFRVRWANEETETKWCPSCPIGEMPDEQMAAAWLTGWELPTDVQLGAEDADRDAMRRKIVASIDAGLPVAAYPANLNMAVIYGYEDGGSTLLLSDYMAKDEPVRLPIGELGPMQTYLGEYRDPPPLRESLLEALRTAVRNWRHERHDGGLPGREYWYGRAALDAWIGDLRRYDGLSDDAKAAMSGLDSWNYTSLHDARQAAAKFLRDWGILLDGDAHAALERAAQLYEQESEALETLLADRRAAKKAEDWSEEARRREADILTQAIRLETEAIAAIEKAPQGFGD
ncbi:MAG: hypothetical protein PVH68_15295 [Armatimonadota bacterium]